MDKTIATLLTFFESFFKRSILPSSVFLFFYFRTGNQSEQLNKLLEQEHYIAIIIIALISISFLMSIGTQMFFDNNMKKNFNSQFFYKDENKLLNQLREKVIIKLQQEHQEFDSIEQTDFILYQIIGRKINTNTSRYIDDIKSSGIIFLSLMIIPIIYLVNNLGVLPLITTIIIVPSVYFFAQEYIKSKYRSRAFRLYINYIIG